MVVHKLRKTWINMAAYEECSASEIARSSSVNLDSDLDYEIINNVNIYEIEYRDYVVFYVVEGNAPPVFPKKFVHLKLGTVSLSQHFYVHS